MANSREEAEMYCIYVDGTFDYVLITAKVISAEIVARATLRAKGMMDDGLYHEVHLTPIFYCRN